jgi:hypothetical protein
MDGRGAISPINILGVSQTQTTFAARYPIELTPSGSPSIPATWQSAGIATSPPSTRGG